MYVGFRRVKRGYPRDVEGKSMDVQKNLCKHEKVWLIQIAQDEVGLLI
jgi:hypothetical protein